MQIYSNLLLEFKNYLGNELKGAPTRNFENVFYINKARVRDIAFFFR